MLAKHELRRAAQAFFASTRAWQIVLAAVPVAADQVEVPVSMNDPLEQDLVRVEAAWFDGRKLGVASVSELDSSEFGDWRARTGAPTRFYQMVPGVVCLYPTPTDAAETGLVFRVAAQPSDAATGIPNDMAVRFTDEIHEGAKARLMLYPNKPWTNLQLAGVHAGAFAAATDSANLAAAKSFSTGRLVSRPKWC